MSSHQNGDGRMKNPHGIHHKYCDVDFTLSFVVAKKFKKTTTAMARLASMEIRDDAERRRGNDDYSLSLGILMLAFDTFIRELYKGKSPGKIYYDFTKPCELTIFLLWILRHTWTHNGGSIDGECRRNYKKTVNKLAYFNPIIDLPKDLQIDYQIAIGYSDYLKIKECIFEYIKQRVSENDYKALEIRSQAVPDDFMVNVIVPYGNEIGTLSINLAIADEYGFKLDYKNGKLLPPQGAKYNKQKQVIELPDGRSFPVIQIKES